MITTGMSPGVTARVDSFLADFERTAVRKHVLAVVVAGSAARGEEIWHGETLVSDIDLMFLTRHTNPLITRKIATAMSPHAAAGIDGGPTPIGSVRRYATLAFHEAAESGVLVMGKLQLHDLVPPLAAQRIPIWEAVRVLSNRLMEHVKFRAGLSSAERAVAKSYEALAEAGLVLEGRYAPTYGRRRDELLSRPLSAFPAETTKRALVALDSRLDGSQPAALDVDTALDDLLDGLRTALQKDLGTRNSTRRLLSLLAVRERHRKHRLFGVVAATYPRASLRQAAKTDPIIAAWQSAFAYLTCDKGDPLRVLSSWRASPQILRERART